MGGEEGVKTVLERLQVRIRNIQYHTTCNTGLYNQQHTNTTHDKDRVVALRDVDSDATYLLLCLRHRLRRSGRRFRRCLFIRVSWCLFLRARLLRKYHGEGIKQDAGGECSRGAVGGRWTAKVLRKTGEGVGSVP